MFAGEHCLQKLCLQGNSGLLAKKKKKKHRGLESKGIGLCPNLSLTDPSIMSKSLESMSINMLMCMPGLCF